MKISLIKLKYLVKRSSAFILDYIFFISLFGIILYISSFFTPVLAEGRVNFAFIVIVLLSFFLYMLKDLIKGISIGKWCVGLMIRDAAYPDIIPSLWILIKRNFIALTAYPFEFGKIIFDENNQRFADINFATIVIDNPNKADFKLRILTAASLLIYFFLSFSDILFSVFS